MEYRLHALKYINWTTQVDYMSENTYTLCCIRFLRKCLILQSPFEKFYTEKLFNTKFLGCIQLKKIKFESNLEHEYIENFQHVKIAFKTLGVQKV